MTPANAARINTDRRCLTSEGEIQISLAGGGNVNKVFISILLFGLTACATDRPPDNTAGSSSGPTIYGQLSVSVDNIRSE